MNILNRSESRCDDQWWQCYDCWTIFSIYKETDDIFRL